MAIDRQRQHDEAAHRRERIFPPARQLGAECRVGGILDADHLVIGQRRMKHVGLIGIAEYQPWRQRCTSAPKTSCRPRTFPSLRLRRKATARVKPQVLEDGFQRHRHQLAGGRCWPATLRDVGHAAHQRRGWRPCARCRPGAALAATAGCRARQRRVRRAHASRAAPTASSTWLFPCPACPHSLRRWRPALRRWQPSSQMARAQVDDMVDSAASQSGMVERLAGLRRHVVQAFDQVARQAPARALGRPMSTMVNAQHPTAPPLRPRPPRPSARQRSQRSGM